MTEEIDGTVQNSTECGETNCADNLLTLDDTGIIKHSRESFDTHVATEKVSKIILLNEKSVSMTKNKDCVDSSESNEVNRIPLDTEKHESSIESEQDQNSEENVENNAQIDFTEDKSSIERVNEQTLSEGVERHASVDEVEHELSTEEKERQSSMEEKSHPSTWSFSQWSDNYESLEDERPIEDIGDDPQKLILWAAEKNELETLRKLLDEDPNLVNARDNDLYTPLHRASYSNNVEVIKMLLSFDADIGSKTADGWQPLHCACKWDSVEAVSLLLQNGAEVNALTKGNITPLHLAASNVSGRRTLELLLWQPYIDPNIKNDAGDTAYDVAYRTGPLGALFEILEESVNVY